MKEKYSDVLKERSTERVHYLIFKHKYIFYQDISPGRDHPPLVLIIADGHRL
jgi:hypothetical protein